MTPPSQPEVDAYFDAVARWWRDVYGAPTVDGAIYRRRRDRVMRWIDNLALAPGSNVLEVGGGAGLLAAELAGRGHRVVAVDSSQAMVDAIRLQAERLPDGRLETRTADVHELDMPDACFDVVVAVGVLPWLHDPVRALREMARVARPAGSVIVTSDNRRRLSHALDPKLTPSLRPLRHAVRRRLALGRLVSPEPPTDLARMYDADQLLSQLSAADLEVDRMVTVGFGPFTIAGRGLVPERLGVRLDGALQRLADERSSGLADRGSHHVLLARRRT